MSGRRDLVEAYVVMHPGCTVREVADSTGVNHETVYWLLRTSQRLTWEPGRPPARGGRVANLWYPLDEPAPVVAWWPVSASHNCGMPGCEAPAVRTWSADGWQTHRCPAHGADRTAIAQQLRLLGRRR